MRGVNQSRQCWRGGSLGSSPALCLVSPTSFSRLEPTPRRFLSGSTTLPAPTNSGTSFEAIKSLARVTIPCSIAFVRRPAEGFPRFPVSERSSLAPFVLNKQRILFKPLVRARHARGSLS